MVFGTNAVYHTCINFKPMLGIYPAAFPDDDVFSFLTN